MFNFVYFFEPIVAAEPEKLIKTVVTYATVLNQVLTQLINDVHVLFFHYEIAKVFIEGLHKCH